MRHVGNLLAVLAAALTAAGLSWSIYATFRLGRDFTTSAIVTAAYERDPILNGAGMTLSYLMFHYGLWDVPFGRKFALFVGTVTVGHLFWPQG